jgi:hypothetical protein
MEKTSYKNHFIFSSIFLIALVQAFGIATENYVFLILVYAAFIFIYLFYINKTGLLFLILSARILLDSIPFITYPKLAFGLSFMEYFALGLMSFMLIYLLVYKGIEFDAISKSMIGVFGAMCLTTFYHGNIVDLIDIGSLWLYFILAYIFFKHLLRDIHIKQILIIIAIISLYPFLNQLYSIVIGAGSMHLGFARYAGTFYHPHFISNYLFFAIPAALYLFITENRVKAKAVYVAIISLCHIGIFMASYRTTWIALFVFWIVYILFVSRRKFIAILLLTLITLVSWNFVGDILSAKLMPVKIILENPSPLFSLQNYEYNRLLSGRIGLWTKMLEVYMESDFIEKIIGLGIHSTEERISFYMHNEYISTLVELGVAGLVTLIVWIVFVIKTIFKDYSCDKRYLCMIFAVFTSSLVIAFGTMPFRNVVIINYMAIYFATIFNSDIKGRNVDLNKSS